MVVTTIFLPLALPLLIRGTEVDAFGIARFPVLRLLLPIFAGVFVKVRRAELARRFRPLMEWLSGLAMMLMVALVLVIRSETF
jgi:predicted Na+-dependent transporter